jgi:F-type H+-transporting ATPase subunit delta
MKDRKLATRYARALLAALTDPDESRTADEFLASLAGVMEQSSEFRTVMQDPAFPRSSRKAVIDAIAEPHALPAALGRFLHTIIDNNRVGALPSIAAMYHEKREEALGIVPAEIATAVPLDDAAVARARRTLEKMTGRDVRLECKVEPELLGGAVTRVGSKVYDGSLRTQLAQLKRRLVQE